MENASTSAQKESRNIIKRLTLTALGQIPDTDIALGDMTIFDRIRLESCF